MIHNLTKEKDDEKLIHKIKQKFPHEKNIYISYGWIDAHIHLFTKSIYHLSRKHFQDLKGVVAVIDAGSSGVDNFVEAYQENNKNFFKTFYFLNVASRGISKYREINETEISLTKYQELKKQYPEILGFKLRFSHQAINENIDYEKILIKLSQLDTKTMYHVGNEPPPFKMLINYIKSNDIITHYAHGKNNNIIANIATLQKKQIFFDVGMGYESLSLKTFFKLLKNKVYPTSLSTDLHNKTFQNNSARLHKLIALMLESDLQLPEIINMVTINPYQNYLHQSYVNYLQTKTIFTIVEDENNYFADSYQNQIKLKHRVKVLGVINEQGEKWY